MVKFILGSATIEKVIVRQVWDCVEVPAQKSLLDIITKA